MESAAIGRRLLSLADNMPLTHELSLHGPALIMTAVAMVIVVIAVVAMCVCNQNSSPQLQTISPRKSTMDEIHNGVQSQPNHVAVDMSTESPTDPLLNGSARNSNSPDGQLEVNKRESNPGSAPRSSATLSRQLPDPPVAKETQGGSPADNHSGTNSEQRNSRVSNSSAAEANYDHLRQSKSAVKEEPGYDHVEGVLAGRQEDNPPVGIRENIYCTPSGESDSGSGTITAANVAAMPARRENIYAVPNGESDSGSGIVGGRENDYTVPTGEEDPYSVIPNKHAASNVYAQVDRELDPYACIDSGNKVTPRLAPVAAPTSVEIDEGEYDPNYSSVRLGRPDSSAAASANMSPPAMTPSSTAKVDDEDATAFDDEMYAEVKKPSRGNQSRSLVAPAVPDRGYGEDEVETSSSAILMVSSQETHAQPSDPAAPAFTTVDSSGRPKRNGDENYCDVTARESLARMHERQHLQGAAGGASAAASPGFDPVKDLPENYYASVDGNSADGAFSAQGAIALDPDDKRLSIASETYAEINPSGGSFQNVPHPPPLDSLKTVIQHHVDPTRKSGGSTNGIDTTPEHNEEGYAIVSKKAAQGIVNKASLSASRSVDEHLGQLDPRRRVGLQIRVTENRLSAPLATVESDHDLSIDHVEPGYQTVKDTADMESELDFDPNYETVEETKKRAEEKKARKENSQNERRGRPNRQHEYEEVTDVRNNGQETSDDIRKRVIRSHQYEIVSEVKEQHKKRHHKNPEQ